MSMKEIYFIISFLLIFFLIGCSAEKQVVLKDVIQEKEIISNESNVSFFPPEKDIVFMVPEGDILTLPSGFEVSLIGVKAPEQGQPCSEEAKNALKDLTLNKNIVLQRDVSDTDDPYYRYLRYVFVDGIFVNEFMIRNGFARFVPDEQNTNYSGLLYEAEINAIANRLCLWKDLKEEPCLFVAFFSYDAEGVDEYNLNEEFVTFRNICKANINLTGWTVQDSSEPYVFPEFVLGPEAGITIHSGKGNDSETHLYWNNELSVWNDESDTLYFRNTNGDLIVNRHY